MSKRIIDDELVHVPPPEVVTCQSGVTPLDSHPQAGRGCGGGDGEVVGAWAASAPKNEASMSIGGDGGGWLGGGGLGGGGEGDGGGGEGDGGGGEGGAGG